MCDVIFGGDLNLFAVVKSQLPNIKELEIRDILETHLVENGGKVESYSFNSANVQRQFYSTTEDKIKEYIKGDGLLSKI